MYKISKQEARTYLKCRGLLSNSIDIIELADDFLHTLEVYSNKDSSSLLMIQKFGDMNATIHADSMEAFNECIEWLPSTENLTFRVNQKWLADALQDRIGVSVYWINYHYAYTKEANPTGKTAKCLGEGDFLAAKRCAEQKDDLPEGHLARIDHALMMQLRGEPSRVFGQIINGELVSYVRLNPMHLSDIDEDRIWDVTDIWTAEEYRGQGLAKDTLAMSTSWIVEHGKIPFYSGVKFDNVPSQRTCKSVGFEKISESIFLR